jgi:peptide/nickel transport system permease protein
MTIDALPTQQPDVKTIEPVVTAPLSPGQLVWRRFRKHRMALIGAIGIALLLIFIVVGSLIVPESATRDGNLRARLLAPSLAQGSGSDMSSTVSSMVVRSPWPSACWLL